MAAHRRFDIEELTNRPGTYFNPLTEVMIVVDDTPDLDHEIFAGEEFEDNEWVLISEESPLDEHRRDELIERFQVAFHQGWRDLSATMTSTTRKTSSSPTRTRSKSCSDRRALGSRTQLRTARGV